MQTFSFTGVAEKQNLRVYYISAHLILLGKHYTHFKCIVVPGRPRIAECYQDCPRV